MKKLLTLVAVCAVTLAANAQIVSSSSRSITGEETPANYANYHRVYFSYAPTSFSESLDEEMFMFKKALDGTATGLAIGWIGGWNIMKTAPLYLETGIEFRYSFMNTDYDFSYNYYDDYNNDYYYGKEKYEWNIKAFNLKVPVNLSYKIKAKGTDGLSFAPYAGLHLNWNLTGKGKEKGEYYGSGDNDYEYGEGRFNLFKDEMGDYKAEHIQFGYQVGLGVNYKALYVGVGYSGEFTEYMKDVKTGGFTASIGYNFKF